MGSIYQRGPGNFWIQWRENGQKRYAHGYETRELAQKVLSKIVSDIAAGRAGLSPDPKSTPTLAVLAEDWLDRRKKTHRAASDDVNRWRKHLKPFFGNCRPSEVDSAGIRRFVERKLADGLNAATVGHCVRLLSTFYSDLIERGFASVNPVHTVPRSTRRLYRPTTDPLTTPFIEELGDVRRVFLSLPHPINVAFAVGAFAGLRTGEVLGLEWHDVNLATRKLRVRQQLNEGKLTSLKDDQGRIVPIQEALATILAAYKLKTGGKGLLFRAGWNGLRGGTATTRPFYMRSHTLHRYLKKAIAECKLPALTWYQATRHTFASLWVINGGSMEKLALILGHSSVVVTQRYAHLRVDLFREADYRMLNIDLSKPGEVVELPAAEKAVSDAAGYAVATQTPKPTPTGGVTS